MKKARIAVGGFVHETHGFSGQITTIDHFRQSFYWKGEELLAHFGEGRGPMDGAVCTLREQETELLPLVYASCTPSGPIEASAFHTILEELLGSIREQEELDGILLILHGAMIAQGIPDCEGVLLAAVRNIVGDSCKIVAVLDMHANISEDMVRNADVLIGYHQNPHVDAYERGVEAARTICRLPAEKTVAKAFIPLPLLLSPLTNWTEAYPMLPVVKRADEWRQDSRIINITVSGGFAYADSPCVGVSVLVQTDGDYELAENCASDLAGIFWSNRYASGYCGISVKEAVAKALFVEKRPVLLADMGDNVGGGSAGDGTFLLKELLDTHAKDSLVVLCDEEAVRTAQASGEGGLFQSMVGGKTDAFHGEPVPFKGIVRKLKEGKYTLVDDNHFSALLGSCIDMGDCALVEGEEVTLFLTSRRVPPGDLLMFEHMGVDLKRYKIITAKSAVAFRSVYSKLSSEIYDVNTGGICGCDLLQNQYKKLGREVFPIVTETAYSCEVKKY